jgi:hypothetical protein
MTREMAEACMADYARFEFHLVAQRLQIFCSEDLGAFWLDVLKDRLYTTGRDSKARRSAQSALHLVMQMVLRLMAPILSFTAEEAGRSSRARRRQHLLPHVERAPPRASRGSRARREVDAHPRDPRRGPEAHRGGARRGLPRLVAPGRGRRARCPADRSWLRSLGDDLRFALITSQARVERRERSKVDVGVSANPKCERCWHYRADVGSVASHPTLCARCASNLDGPGRCAAMLRRARRLDALARAERRRRRRRPRHEGVDLARLRAGRGRHRDALLQPGARLQHGRRLQLPRRARRVAALVLHGGLDRRVGRDRLHAAAQRTTPRPSRLALVLGGALGNLYDRATLGHVVDFVQLHAAGYYWPAFNVADSAITSASRSSSGTASAGGEPAIRNRGRPDMA